MNKYKLRPDYAAKKKLLLNVKVGARLIYKCNISLSQTYRELCSCLLICVDMKTLILHDKEFRKMLWLLEIVSIVCPRQIVDFYNCI